MQWVNLMTGINRRLQTESEPGYPLSARDSRDADQQLPGGADTSSDTTTATVNESVNGHSYFEIAESGRQPTNYIRDNTDINARVNSPYQELDPSEVMEISARQPPAYDDLGRQQSPENNDGATQLPSTVCKRAQSLPILLNNVTVI